MQGEGYSTAYTSVEDDNSLQSIPDGLTNYTEKQSATDTSVTNLTDHAAFLTQRIETKEQQINMLMNGMSLQQNQQMMQPFQHQQHLQEAASYAPVQQPIDIAQQTNKRLANKRFAPSGHP